MNLKTIPRPVGAQWLKAAREKLGLEITELAHRLGVAPATLYYWELGYHATPLAALVVIEAWQAGWTERRPWAADGVDRALWMRTIADVVGMTPQELAVGLGVDVRTVMRYLRGWSLKGTPDYICLAVEVLATGPTLIAPNWRAAR